MVRYHGVLSSHARARAEVVPRVEDATVVQLPLFKGDRTKARAATVLPPEPRRKPWAWLLRHVFEIDVSTCQRCGGATRWLEAATKPDAIARLLQARPGPQTAAQAAAERPAPPRVPRGLSSARRLRWRGQGGAPSADPDPHPPSPRPDRRPDHASLEGSPPSTPGAPDPRSLGHNSRSNPVRIPYSPTRGDGRGACRLQADARRVG